MFYVYCLLIQFTTTRAITRTHK